VKRARAVALTACIGVTLAGCGSSQPTNRSTPDRATTSTTRTQASSTTPTQTTAAAPHPNLGPFAGYIWNGDVDSARADWAVPGLLPGSPRGAAATWIGAEASGPTGVAPFVQVGINEGNTDGTPFYYAFYSSTRLRFHPVELFDVTPGDQVSAALSRRGARWQIEFVDLTVGRQRRVSVVEGVGRRFNEAQYSQEDVTDARTHRPFPYPSLSPLRFTAVAVNGMVPQPSRLTANWLTEPEGYLAPGPLQRDGFALAQTQMTGAGLRYLRAIAAQDNAAVTAIVQLLGWAQVGPTHAAGAAARRLATDLRTTVSMLGDERWPTAAGPAISTLRADALSLIALLSTRKSTTPAERFAWTQRVDHLVGLVTADGRTGRQALRLPSPTVPRAGR